MKRVCLECNYDCLFYGIKRDLNDELSKWKNNDYRDLVQSIE